MIATCQSMPLTPTDCEFISILLLFDCALTHVYELSAAQMVSVHVCPAADRMDFTDRNYVFKTMPLAELFARAAALPHALQVWVRLMR